MPFAYPISLEVSGRRAVVIGEDAVAHGKADDLLEAGADVSVIATGPERSLTRLEGLAHVTLHRRGYLPGDLRGAFLCVASSPDEAERESIFREARALGVIVNLLDDPARCDFAAPAIVRRGDLMIAISTGGRSPALASRLRGDLERRFGDEWADVLRLLGEVREETLPLLPDLKERARRWRRALDLEELEGFLRSGRSDEAREALRARLLEGVA
jgi:precorrin-2 dehydrogenase